METGRIRFRIHPDASCPARVAGTFVYLTGKYPTLVTVS